jgi:tetratricopeptide (TPR) repeat protein
MKTNRTLFALFASALVVWTTGCPSTPPVVVDIDPIASVDSLGMEAAYQSGVEALAETPPNYELARASFERVVALDTHDLVWEAHMNLGVVYTDLALYPDAVESFDHVLRLQPDSIEARLGKGKAYALWGNLEQALAAYREVLQMAPDNLEAKLNIAAIYVDRGDTAQARTFIGEVLVAEQNNVDALNLLGRIYAREGDEQMATYLWEKAVQQNPEASDALNNLALLQVEGGTMSRAARQFMSVTEADPANIAAHLNLGAIYLDHINYAGALDEFEQVLSLRPRHETALMGRAAALWGMDQPEDARTAYERVVEYYPDNAQAMWRLGDLNFRVLDDVAAATRWYEGNLRARGMDPVSCDRSDEVCARLQGIRQMGEQTAPRDAGDEDDSSDDDGGDE